VGNLGRRLENLERLVEVRVEARVMEELELVVDRLEHHLTREELRRVLEILAGGEEEEARQPAAGFPGARGVRPGKAVGTRAARRGDTSW
jgi:hypothetical protein